VLTFFPSGEEAEASEEESEHGIDAGNYVDDEYPEEAPEVTGQELMEMDGKAPLAFYALPGAPC
jgi:116 kDa U5 small nuclear ribonucleoprotein component